MTVDKVCLVGQRSGRVRLSVRKVLLNGSVSTRVPAAGERGPPLLLPLHPGPENGHQAARRRRLRGEGGPADEEM